MLGIESSCDDTGVAIVSGKGCVLSNCSVSQLIEHNRNGGIIPMIAKEYHLQNIDRVARQAFECSNLSSFKQDVDVIAVCNRPGLDYSLQVGLNYARTLAKKHSKPIVPVHHMQAHALMPLLQNRSIRFPFIALLLSGGHCLLSIVERHDKFHLLGGSRDIAPGEVLDKFARRFRFKNLGHPFDELSGGASVEKLASLPTSNPYKYFVGDRSVPMLGSGTCEFSFSGYRSNYEKEADRIDELWRSGDLEKLKLELGHICASLQRVILVQIVKKLQRALLFYTMHWRHSNRQAFARYEGEEHLGFKIHNRPPDGGDLEADAVDVVISGGVAANKFLVDGVRTFCMDCSNPPHSVYSPTKDLCSDNGLMIAWNGLLRIRGKGLEQHACDPIDESVIHDGARMDMISVRPSCPIGLDIGAQVRSANFKLPKIGHPLFKILH